MNELKNVPLWLWICLAFIILLQGTWLFLDALKRGKRAWFWGLWGTVSVPTPTVVYCLIIYLEKRKTQRGSEKKKK